MRMADLEFWRSDVRIKFLNQHFQADVRVRIVTRRDFFRDGCELRLLCMLEPECHEPVV